MIALSCLISTFLGLVGERIPVCAFELVTFASTMLETLYFWCRRLGACAGRLRLCSCFLAPLRILPAEIEAQGAKLQAIRLARLQDPLGGEFTAEDQAEAMARLKALKASVRALRLANAPPGAIEVASGNSLAAGGGQDAEADMSRCSSSATAVAPVLGGRH